MVVVVEEVVGVLVVVVAGAAEVVEGALVVAAVALWVGGTLAVFPVLVFKALVVETLFYDY